MVCSLKDGAKVSATGRDIAVRHPALNAESLKCVAHSIGRTHILVREADENIQRNEKGAFIGHSKSLVESFEEVNRLFVPDEAGRVGRHPPHAHLRRLMGPNIDAS